MPSVSIAIQPDIFDRFSDLNFKSSQALAEFVDNAIQSYLDFKNNSAFYRSGYKLTIDIVIDWAESSDHKTYAKSITIRDNAAGMAIDKFEKAFETGHRPAFNEGLNEYGMGMKTAAYWLSKQWTIISKSFAETTERTLSFDVDDIVKNRRTSIDFQEKHVSGNESYTIVRLENLHKKNNFTKRMLAGIKSDLASIYRAFLRRGEIQINVNNEALLFTDPKILVAPYFGDPNGPAIEWKKTISCNLFGKEITGFIGILHEMSEKQSGLVIMRRGRVIVGESSDHLYHPEILHGTYKNGFTYKRIYGEIEIKGFSASFNKNGFSNMDELESMLELIKKTLKVEGYSLIKQANGFRVMPPKQSQNATVTWIFGNGTSNRIDKYDLNSKLIQPQNPEKTGYKFIGWDPAVEENVTSNATYTALWTPLGTSTQPSEEFEVRWVLNNGLPDKVVLYKGGSKLTIPNTPHKPGYTFEGWSPNPSDIVKEHALYSALWKANPAQPQPEAIAYKTFIFDGNTANMLLIKAKNADGAPLLSLNMEQFATKNNVLAMLNVTKLPIANKSVISEDVKNVLLSLAIGMFEAQMKGEDTCDGLMKNIR